MNIALTGHRPHKLGHEYDGIGLYSNGIRKLLTNIIATYPITQGITGMALGADMIWAEVLIANNIPFIAAIPCAEQWRTWAPKSQERWRRIILNPLCTEHYVSDQPYDRQCMQNRNIWMVDHSDLLIAIWDGTRGGTCNCVDYASSLITGSRPTYNLLTYTPAQLLML